MRYNSFGRTTKKIARLFISQFTDFFHTNVAKKRFLTKVYLNIVTLVFIFLYFFRFKASWNPNA